MQMAAFQRFVGYFALLALLVSSAGCEVFQRPVRSDPTVTEPAVEEAPAEVAPAPQPAAVPEPVPGPAPVPTSFQIDVLLTSEAPQYTQVGDELVRLAGPGNARIFNLNNESATARAAIEDLRESGGHDLVAVGLLAAKSARQIEDRKYVFCQVFNFGAHDLISSRSRGISVTPDVAPAVKLWKKLAPHLETVGVITGPGHEELIEEASIAFDHEGIKLEHRVTNSDKETSLELQRMLPEIQGFWLLPDNRVLSASVLREIMSLTRGASMGVLVPDKQFLSLGGLMSASGRPASMAQRAWSLLKDARDARDFPGSGLVYGTECELWVNPQVAADLGYDTTVVPPGMMVQ